MEFCEECFSNIEIKSIIKNSDTIGNCDFDSEHKNVYVCNIDSNKNTESIKDILRQIIDIYTPDKDLPDDFPKEKSDLLRNALEKRWSLFNIGDEQIFHLLNELFKDDIEIDKRLFEGIVGVKEEMELNDERLIVSQNRWDSFANSIKFENRFHTTTINLDVLEHFLQYTEKQITPEEMQWYRCRISNEKDLSIDEMSAPPKERATAGRLNAEWISTLYLCDNPDACVQEVRAGFHDKVYIGNFKLNKSIKVADLRNFEDITLDPRGDFLVQYYLNRDVLSKISSEFGKPANKDDKGMHYLPLQYISDFIKSCDSGFEGILYKSVMDNNSINLVMFDSNLASCQSVQQKVITGIDYKMG